MQLEFCINFMFVEPYLHAKDQIKVMSQCWSFLDYFSKSFLTPLNPPDNLEAPPVIYHKFDHASANITT